MTLANARCVITGATSGIGLATARALLAAGAEVVAVARDRAKLAALVSEHGPRFVPIQCDLASADARRRATEELRSLGGPVAVLVNNAGECTYDSPLSCAPERLSRLLEINVTAGLELCQALAPLMQPGSQIIQVSSVSARHLPNPKFGPYGATKAALDHLTEALRLELAPRGIRVGSIVPGLVDTPIYDKVEGFERTRAKLHEQVPTWLRPEDVADAILWMLTRPPHVAVSDLTVLPSTQSR